ncbi:MAG: hypothetical protein GX078_03645 [Clostridiales bacterium]|nr:hypothetical protein [Clostridiales bacterium]
MRKVILTMNENEKFQIIKKLVNTNGNKRTACLKLGCSLRHINRLVAGYKDSGKAFFVHGSRGRKLTTTLPVDDLGIAAYHLKGTSAMVIKTFDNHLYTCINEKIYVLEKLLNHKPSSKSFDLAQLPSEAKKKYIPPMSHPWKQASFERYMKKQAHRKNIA